MSYISKESLPPKHSELVSILIQFQKYNSADLSAVVIILHSNPQLCFLNFAKHAWQFHDITQKTMKYTSFTEAQSKKHEGFKITK